MDLGTHHVALNIDGALNHMDSNLFDTTGPKFGTVFLLILKIHHRSMTSKQKYTNGATALKLKA